MLDHFPGLPTKPTPENHGEQRHADRRRLARGGQHGHGGFETGRWHGTGTINGNVISSGHPGSAIGAIGGTLTLTGGSWTGAGTVAKAVTVSSGAFNLGGTLTAPLGLAVTGAGKIAGIGQLTGSLNYTSTASSAFAGVIADGTAKSKLTMNKAGSTLTLTGTNTYTGATTVTSGTLVVNGSLADTPVVVNSGGILAGSGTIKGVETINSGGILAPSNGGFIPTTLTVGSLTSPQHREPK